MFPSWQNAEVLWHLPLLPLGFGGLAVAFVLVRSCLRRRREKKAERLMEELYDELWDAWTFKKILDDLHFWCKIGVVFVGMP